MHVFVKTADGYTLTGGLSVAEYVAAVHGAVTIRSLYERATTGKAIVKLARLAARKKYFSRTGLNPKLRENWEGLKDSPEFAEYCRVRAGAGGTSAGLVAYAGLDRTVGEFLESRDMGQRTRQDVIEAVAEFEDDPLLVEFLKRNAT